MNTKERGVSVEGNSGESEATPVFPAPAQHARGWRFGRRGIRAQLEARYRKVEPTDSTRACELRMTALRQLAKEQWGALGTDMGRAKWRRPGYGSLHMKLLMTALRKGQWT